MENKKFFIYYLVF